MLTNLMYPGMLKYDKDYKLQPELAEEFKISEDNLTYTLKLRKYLKWQEGEPLTIKDVEFTFNTIAKSTYDEDRKSVLENIKGVEEFSKGKTDKIVFKVTNADTVKGELENKTVDIADITGLKKDDKDELKNEGFSITKYPENGMSYMGMNLREDKFKDVRVRQAIQYGINREEALKSMDEATGTLISVPIPPSSWAYPKDTELEEYKYDVDKAKSLLKESGWEDKDNDRILENDKSEKFQVTLHCPSGNKTAEKRAVIVQSNLKDIGIKVDIKTLEFSTIMQQVVGDHEFDLYLMGNELAIDPDPTPYWHSKSASDKKNTFAANISGYRNPEADKLMEDGVKYIDMDKRKEVYKKFAKILNRDVPWICFVSPDVFKASSANVKNYTPVTNLELYNINKLYTEE